MTAVLEVCDAETVQTLLDLLNPLHGSMDQQVNDRRTDEDYTDPPPDREYAVNITAQMERDLTQAVLILESRKRSAPAQPGFDAVREKVVDKQFHWCIVRIVPKIETILEDFGAGIAGERAADAAMKLRKRPALPSTDHSPPSGNAGEPDYTQHQPSRDQIVAEAVRNVERALSGNAGEGNGYYGCALPPGACHCPQESRRAKCNHGYWKVAAPPQPAPDALREACKSSIKRIDELLHDNDCDGAHKELHELAYQFEMLSTPLPSGEPPNAESKNGAKP